MRHRKWVSLFKLLLLLVICGFSMLKWVVLPVQIEGDSMFPTLKNSSLGVSFLYHEFLWGINRFDIVIVKAPNTGELIVKRVIGLPNETISYMNDQLTVNGKIIEEHYLDSQFVVNTRMKSRKPFTYRIPYIVLKDNEYYVLGDNRPRSKDSRYFGPIHQSQIVAKGFIKIR